MSHRVTIKELQARLDEMKEQRDEARHALAMATRRRAWMKRKLDAFFHLFEA